MLALQQIQDQVACKPWKAILASQIYLARILTQGARCAPEGRTAVSAVISSAFTAAAWTGTATAVFAMSLGRKK